MAEWTRRSGFCNLFPPLAARGFAKIPLRYTHMALSKYASEYDGIVKTMQMYIDAGRQGKSEVMRPAFHPGASFFGYVGGNLVSGRSCLTGSIRMAPRRISSPGLSVLTFWSPLQSCALRWTVGQVRSVAPESVCRTYSHC